MELLKPRLAHYKAVRQADRDFESVGEESYSGCTNRMEYLFWLRQLEDQAKPERLKWKENPNEIYMLMGEEEKVLAFGQLRMYDTPDALSWAGHIGYSVPPSLRGQGFAKCILRLLLNLGFARGMHRILLTCDEGNAASRHVIECMGGRFTGHYRKNNYNKRLYWFDEINIKA